MIVIIIVLSLTSCETPCLLPGLVGGLDVVPFILFVGLGLGASFCVTGMVSNDGKREGLLEEMNFGVRERQYFVT